MASFSTDSTIDDELSADQLHNDDEIYDSWEQLELEDGTDQSSETDHTDQQEKKTLKAEVKHHKMVMECNELSAKVAKMEAEQKEQQNEGEMEKEKKQSDNEQKSPIAIVQPAPLAQNSAITEEEETRMGQERKWQRNRIVFTPEQIEKLEKVFEKVKYPDVFTREDLGSQISVNEARVKIWFQNRRYRCQWEEKLRKRVEGEEQKLLTAEQIEKQMDKVEQRQLAPLEEIKDKYHGQLETVQNELHAAKLEQEQQQQREEKGKGQKASADPMKQLQNDQQKRIGYCTTPFTPEQIEILEKMFEKVKYPDVFTREDLGSQISVNEARVKCWFKNRRAKHRREKELRKQQDTNLHNHQTRNDQQPEKEWHEKFANQVMMKEQNELRVKVAKMEAEQKAQKEEEEKEKMQNEKICAAICAKIGQLERRQMDNLEQIKKDIHEAIGTKIDQLAHQMAHFANLTSAMHNKITAFEEQFNAQLLLPVQNELLAAKNAKLEQEQQQQQKGENKKEGKNPSPISSNQLQNELKQLEEMLHDESQLMNKLATISA